MSEYIVPHNAIVYQKITEKISRLNDDEAYEVLKFLDFIFYKRELEDIILAKQIKEGLEDDFLGVEAAKNYLKELNSVEV